MTLSPDPAASQTRRHRTVGQQLHRSPTVIHASLLLGLAVLAGGEGGGFSVAGVLFFALYFSPIYIAYRRDRLSFPIIFATFFLPAWPWAVYQVFRRTPRSHGSNDPGPVAGGSAGENTPVASQQVEPVAPYATAAGDVAAVGYAQAPAAWGSAPTVRRTRRPHPGWAAVLALLAVGMTVLAVFGDSQSNALRSRGVRAPGVISFVSGGRSNDQLVHFTTATGETEVGKTSSTTFYSVGDKVTVVYDPQHPGDNVMIADDLAPASEDRAGAAGAAGVAALGAVGLSGWRPRRRKG